MGPKKLDITVYSDTGLRETVRILGADRLAKDLTGWQVHAGATDSFLATSETLAITATIPDPATGDILLDITPAALAALFPAGSVDIAKTLNWTLLAKPYGTYKVKLCEGALTVQRRVPAWA